MTPSDRALFADPASDAATFVREPQQARSRRTLRRILEASLDLLEAEGPEALTVTRIAKKAKSSVGSFYARFDGKEDLIRYVGEQALDGASGAWEELRRGLGPNPAIPQACDALVRGLAEILLAGPGRPILLLDGLEESERTRLRRFEDDVSSGLRSLAGSDASARVAAMATTGVLSQAAHGSSDADRARLLDELVRLVVGYFGATPAPITSPDAGLPQGDAASDTTDDRSASASTATNAEEPSPWEAASSGILGGQAAQASSAPIEGPAGAGPAPTRPAPAEPAPPAQPAPPEPARVEAPSEEPEDDISQLEGAFRDLGAELDGSETVDPHGVAGPPPSDEATSGDAAATTEPTEGPGAETSDAETSDVETSAAQASDEAAAAEEADGDAESEVPEADPFDVWG